MTADPGHPERIYAGTRDQGLWRSADGGRTWQSPQSGLRHGYLFGVAVAPADPETVVVSAASGPARAYSAKSTVTHVYMKRGGGPWTQVSGGLPEPKGTTIGVFAILPGQPHTIYAANNRGLFRSRDAGDRWERLEVPWPGRFLEQSVQGLVVQQT